MTVYLFADAGAGAIALLQTEPAPNNFPGLPPVREGEHMLVRVDRVPDVGCDVEAFLAGPPQVLRLEPTDRSFLRS